MTTDAKAGGRIVDDNRGAILVAAVFMATFLVGCLWYLVGIGDAAIYREKMQDASDAVAFSSAVYHARGMNIIAVLNLVMAAALAVLIAFKIAEIIAFTVAAVCYALAWVTGGATIPIAEAATEIGVNLHDDIIPSVQKVVDAVLKASSASQKVVALVSPWAGAARGAVMANQYKPTVKGGVAVSLSMIPMGDRLGLPVQEEPFDKLCKRAGEMVGDLAFGWIPGLEYIGGFIGKIAGSFPGYFCGGGSSSGALNDQKDLIKQQCADAKKQYEEANKDNKSAPPFDQKKCEKDGNDKLKGGGTGGMGDTGGKTSKMIYAPAVNGDDYFQVYGFVMGDNQAMHQNAQKRVEMPAWGKATVSPSSVTDTLEKVGFAEAEFYFDQVPGVPKTKGQAWDDYKDQALWNMRWRARLRRFRLPTQISMDKINGAIGGVSGVPADLKQAGQGWVTDAASAINGAVDQIIVH